jgi:glutathione peroxidase-family protein
MGYLILNALLAKYTPRRLKIITVPKISFTKREYAIGIIIN